MTAGIDHQAAPGEARLVANGDGGNCESVRINFDKLQKRLQTAENAERGCGVQLRALGRDVQRVAFVFAELLNFFQADRKHVIVRRLVHAGEQRLKLQCVA